jgi:PEP-CTERM motif
MKKRLPREAIWCILAAIGKMILKSWSTTLYKVGSYRLQGGIMRKGHFLPLGVVVTAAFISPLTMRADTIKGTTTGSTISGVGVDDTNTVTTMNVSFQTFCSWLLYGMQSQFSGVNVTFAGGGSNIGNLFTAISASDFTISQYAPWVVNNWVATDANGMVTGGMNYISSPAMVNGNNLTFARGVQGQDAGGADIVISYNPQAASDPTKVNFIQSFVTNFNNSNPSYLSGVGGIDNIGSRTPFYNTLGFAGSGTTFDGITLTASANSAAWLADIPYVCASVIPTAQLTIPVDQLNCTGGVANSLRSATEVFQTFVESTQSVCYNSTLSDAYYLPVNNNCIQGGTEQSWDVLYGGVQWGFTYTNTNKDTPEPSAVLLLGAGLIGVTLKRRILG